MYGIRRTYFVLFFANAIFAALFKALGEDTLGNFGSFHDCNRNKNASCRGNQMVFRASFSIAVSFAIRILLSRVCQPKRRLTALLILFGVEIPVYVSMLIGSFFIPSSFFDGYAHFARVVSGFFILFQIVSIADFSYQLRDVFLDKIEEAQKQHNENASRKTTWWCIFWKVGFLGFCVLALAGASAGTGYLYHKYGSCQVGVGFTTVTVVFVALFLVMCVSSWLNVGLLPPCVVAVYLVLMCWQALTSNPNKSCERGYTPSRQNESPNAVVYNAIIGAFSMTWTSWRTSSAADKMFNKKPSATRPAAATTRAEVSSAAVVHLDEVDIGSASTPTAQAPPEDTSILLPEPWQFHVMMFLGSVYMAMVLTDWNSTDRSSNGVSMWVKIVAQWLTILLFLWTLVAPKLFPNREFS